MKLCTQEDKPTSKLQMIQILDLYWIIHARLAQSVERWTLNPTVVGSSPTLGEIFFTHNFSSETISRAFGKAEPEIHWRKHVIFLI